MKNTTRTTRFTTPQTTRFTERRSITESLTETLLETLRQTGLRPAFEPAASRRARLGKTLAGIAVLVLGSVLGLYLLRSPGDLLPAVGEPVAVLEILRGPVEVLPAVARQGSTQPLNLGAGAPIYAGAVVTTSDASGPAAFRLAGGQSLRLAANTRVQVASNTSMVLERGAVYLDSNTESSVEVRTTLGVVRDIGTQFEVRMIEAPDGEGAVRIRVRAGKVVLERESTSHEAGAGEELAMGADGTLTRGTSPIYGPHWDWVFETAPVPALEGRPLSAFLDWAVREGGWTLQFADDETARLAPTITLHGDAHNLTPAQAMTMVLSSSGLDYRVDGGTLLVGPEGAG